MRVKRVTVSWLSGLKLCFQFYVSNTSLLVTDVVTVMLK